jgi:Coenzyme PQQ synthesis protein D (PqqD)
MMLRVKDDAVSWAPTEENVVVLLDLRTSTYLSLNASGSILWQRLAHGATESDLREELLQRFQLDADQAAADVTAFLNALRTRDLLAEA